MKEPVVILGAGVAGLSAAQELVDRGVPCVIYEARGTPGGKARSIPLKPGRGELEALAESPALPGARSLHGEHGFRFIPGFYRHLPDTLRRIPSGDGSVLDHLALTRDILIAPDNAAVKRLISGFPVRYRELPASLLTMPTLMGLGIPPREWLVFLDAMYRVLSASPQRRLAELEATSWWDFVRAEEMSEAYRRYLCIGITRALVAMKAQVASTRTIGTIFYQLVAHSLDVGGQLDRVLDGPTSEVWIGPWMQALQQKGVRFCFGTRVE